MGKDWDSDKGGRLAWIAWMTQVMTECLRVMKPGAHGLVWALPRTSHWTATALEDAGFEVRDVVTHLFGTGFPKSLDISKAIDKAAGAERASEYIPNNKNAVMGKGFGGGEWNAPSAPAVTEAAKQWQGFGTSLKPASEHWILVRKPCSEKTVAANVLKWGCGGLNIDGCRVGTELVESGRAGRGECESEAFGKKLMATEKAFSTGRFPANLVLDEEAAQALDEQSIANGIHSAGKARDKGGAFDKQKSMFGIGYAAGDSPRYADGDNPGASRFFYVAKASKSDKGDGNVHPTVKSTALMEYLIKLVTPPNGTVLDPFMGSGSTGVAAKKLGFSFIGIEQEQLYFDIAWKRIKSLAR